MYANKEESGFLFWWWSNYTPDAHNQRSELFDFKITQLKRCKSEPLSWDPSVISNNSSRYLNLFYEKSDYNFLLIIVIFTHVLE